jgi:hypothetical protein
MEAWLPACAFKRINLGFQHEGWKGTVNPKLQLTNSSQKWALLFTKTSAFVAWQRWLKTARPLSNLLQPSYRIDWSFRAAQACQARCLLRAQRRLAALCSCTTILPDQPMKRMGFVDSASRLGGPSWPQYPFRVRAIGLGHFQVTPGGQPEQPLRYALRPRYALGWGSLASRRDCLICSAY